MKAPRVLSAADFSITSKMPVFHLAARSLIANGITLKSVRAKGGSARDFFDLIARQEEQLRIAKPLPMPPRRPLPLPPR